MKPRRTTALALVGWYLMVPPVFHDAAGKLYLDPASDATVTSQWRTVLRRNTEQECAKVRDWWRDNADHEGLDSRNLVVIAVSNRRAQCVASDDPRLKSK